MAGLADDWEENRQTCVDVLCAYLQLPYEPDPGPDAPGPQQLAFQASQKVRQTVIRVITAHLGKHAATSWQGLDLDFTGVVFDGGDFRDAEFSGGTVLFRRAEFSGGEVDFSHARFAGGTVNFDHAQFSGARAVRFGSVKFCGGEVDFRGAVFSGGKVSFIFAEFSDGTVYFDLAQFSGGMVDFRQARDWSIPPRFPWTDTPPEGVMLPETEGQPEA